MNGKRVASTAFAHDAERVESSVLMQIAHLERGDFGAP
jgi:hypothetical protein